MFKKGNRGGPGRKFQVKTVVDFGDTIEIGEVTTIFYFIIIMLSFYLDQVIPELLRCESSVSNVLNFTLHVLTFLSQRDPVDFTNSINKETIENSYRGFFQIFGGHHVSLMLSGFQDYFKTLTKEEQVSMYGFMGSLLNTSLYQNAVTSSCNASSVDMRQLLETSQEDYYSGIDSRLTSFVDSASENQGPEQLKKFSYKMNAVENILKARHLKFVSPIGLMQGILMYIYSGRNNLVTNMFSYFGGAKGHVTSVIPVINRSETTSQRLVPDKVTVYFTFDNVQS